MCLTSQWNLLRCSPYAKFLVPIRSHYRNKNLIWLSECPITNGKSLAACHNAQNSTFKGERLFVFHGGLVFLFDQKSTKPLATTSYRPRVLSFSTRLLLKMFPCSGFSLFSCFLSSEHAVALWMRGELGWIAAEMPCSDTSCSRPREEVRWRWDVDPEMNWRPDDVLTCSRLPHADAFWGWRLRRGQGRCASHQGRYNQARTQVLVKAFSVRNTQHIVYDHADE